MSRRIRNRCGLLGAIPLSIVLTACGGPPADTASTDPQARSIEYEMKVQRAAQAAIWGMPAVGIWDISWAIQRDLRGQEGDVAYLSRPMDSKHGFLTANDVTRTSPRDSPPPTGPLVIEVQPDAEIEAALLEGLDLALAWMQDWFIHKSTAPFWPDRQWTVWQFADDGSVDVYFAPEAPDGMESNWIPTGEDFFLLFRLYGPGEALFDRSWTLPDLERIE